jgi:uncharacterized protein
VAVTVLLWTAVVALVAVGLLGTIAPAIPGIGFVYGALILGAWIDNFDRVGTVTIIILGVMTIFALGVDYVATLAGAKKVGATKLALFCAALGMFFGIFFGPLGFFLGPFVGAFVGQYLSYPDIAKASSVGIGTWVGMLIGVCLKLAVSFLMIGTFVLAYVL